MTTTRPKNKLEVTTEKPVYGGNYNKGYIGFTYNGSFIARGIVHFTHWDSMSDISVSHVLIVTGEDSCIEADASGNCVKQGTLQNYFAENNSQIFFRKPKGLNDEIANQIVATVEPQVGKEYDFKVIYAQAISGSLAGHFLDRLLKGKLQNTLNEIFNRDNKWICSELAAYALDEQPEYKGILKRPNATISPQELFENPDIFEPWHDGKVTECSNSDSNCE